jgi:hypothetical protein
MLEDFRNNFLEKNNIKTEKIEENKEKILHEKQVQNEIKNFKKNEKFQKNIGIVHKSQKEKISQIQKNSEIKAKKVQDYFQTMKETWELRNKLVPKEEQKQKENLLKLEKERQKKVNAYYEKLRNEEANPRAINKEKEKMIEELKNKNIIRSERIKSANFIRDIDMEKRNEKILENIKNREKITKRIFEEKKIIAEQIKEENDEKRRAFDCKYQILEINKKLELEEKREEINEKRKKLDDFIQQKKLIADEMRYLADQYSLKSKIYHEQFDELFSRRGLDEYTYMEIKGMVAGDPKFKDLCKYYEG